MSILYRNLKGIVTATTLTVMYSLPASAQVADPDAVPEGQVEGQVLDQTQEQMTDALPDDSDAAALLARLAKADKPEAARLDRQLQALWRKSGSSAMDLLLRRGEAALEISDTRAAIDHLTALTDHAPDFAQGWYLRARAFATANLLGPAVADLERALSLNPDNYDAIYGLGTIFEALGDPQAAYLAYERARSIHPHHEEVGMAIERLGPDVQGRAL